MIKKAVIVAAGLSSRLYPLTKDRPKGLLPFQNTTILERSVQMIRNLGISEIAIVVGYLKEQIIEIFGDSVTYIENSRYEQTNNMYSLTLAKDFIKEESFLYLHGDIVYSEQDLRAFVNQQEDSLYDASMLVGYGEVDEESMKVRVTNEQLLIESNKLISIQESAGEWIGVAAFSNSEALFSEMQNLVSVGHEQDYDTLALTNLAKEAYTVLCYPTIGPWIEIDFASDYERAKVMFLHEDI
ncbi:phosphocholine cytidylyltransferase family protein [Paenibacillus endoradicis]|uniref:phosphocholine cytidylyltransferase family protein n=1 Tax=Paenibacillus endoradicis TaxID=2972487 RepID=UPI002159755D|nr:phosphocholine cytidylyltransferase family protein [Paenibacillus endoradicis]MCR8660540.1 phosphocholine cytidylyltransferase family protein [Paenibacillus endoradicis]